MKIEGKVEAILEENSGKEDPQARVLETIGSQEIQDPGMQLIFLNPAGLTAFERILCMWNYIL